MNQQEASILNQMEMELEEARLANQKLNNHLGRVSMYERENEPNLIVFQLDLSEEKEKIDHLLRGHVVKLDSEGNEYWAEPDSNDMKPFNTYGVQLLMNVINFYLSRNTILSNYKEEMINWKIEDLGTEIADLILMKYKEMGMDTKEKVKLYPIIVRQILDSIHSAYLRALHGGERESLRTARHVTQNESPGAYQNQNYGGSFRPTSQKKWYNPFTWK